jgi:ribonuclease HI
MSLPLGAAIEVYTDGAAEPSNPGPAGSAFVIVYDGEEVFSWARHLGTTTNNVAEMTAALRALEALRGPEYANAPLCSDLSITIHADSQYLVKGMTEWLPRWKANGWRSADRKPVKNRELWEKLDALASRLPKLEWRWIKGHAGHMWNERADQLANAATMAPAEEDA